MACTNIAGRRLLLTGKTSHHVPQNSLHIAAVMQEGALMSRHIWYSM